MPRIALQTEGSNEEMETIEGYAMTTDNLWPGAEAWRAPMAFFDLDAARDWPELPKLPPCPVIGLGDADHPLASKLDAVVTKPFAAIAIANAIQRHPQAAAALVQLLRMLPDLTVEQGLAAESLAYGVLQGSADHTRWLSSRAPASSFGPRNVRCERADDVLTVTMAHSASGNAIDATMRDALHEAFTLAAIDTTITRVDLQGEGRAFSLGAELGEFGTTRDPATAHAIRQATLPAWPLSRCADGLAVHVQGACVGAGLEMAAWAQRLTAGPKAWFQLPELAMGLIPGAGGCVSLTRRIGRQKTALLVLSGKRLSAREALALGLVDAIADDLPADPGGANEAC